jgi:hypothetical protein
MGKKSNFGKWDLMSERRGRFSILPSTVLPRATVPSARFANALRDATNFTLTPSQKTVDT